MQKSSKIFNFFNLCMLFCTAMISLFVSNSIFSRDSYFFKIFQGKRLMFVHIVDLLRRDFIDYQKMDVPFEFTKSRGMHASLRTWSTCPRAKSEPTSYFYMPTLRANFSVWRAFQFLNFTCQSACQFFNYFSKEFFNFEFSNYSYHLEISIIFEQFLKVYLAKQKI